MNNDPQQPPTIAITGNIILARNEYEQVMRQLLLAAPVPEKRSSENFKVPDTDGKLPRLAFSVKEIAEILGISKATVYRLGYRGLLKCLLALRHRMIAKSEIERFLKDTSRVLE